MTDDEIKARIMDLAGMVRDLAIIVGTLNIGTYVSSGACDLGGFQDRRDKLAKVRMRAQDIIRDLAAKHEDVDLPEFIGGDA